MHKRHVYLTTRYMTALFIALLSFLLFAFPMTSHATEEPEYKVVRKLGDVEVREYGAYSVAEVVVTGAAADAGKIAFPILAGYIFGKNKGERKFAMTAPVTQAAVPVKLDMNAPVTQSEVPGGYLVQFVLPRNVTVAKPGGGDSLLGFLVRFQLQRAYGGAKGYLKHSRYYMER